MGECKSTGDTGSALLSLLSPFPREELGFAFPIRETERWNGEPMTHRFVKLISQNRWVTIM